MCDNILDTNIFTNFVMYKYFLEFRHFFEERHSQCVFLDPEKIDGQKCMLKEDDVRAHILSISQHHDKRFILAPYVQR